jgi:hypothetical protein
MADDCAWEGTKEYERGWKDMVVAIVVRVMTVRGTT